MSCLCYFEVCLMGLIGPLLWPVSVPARMDLLLQLGSLARSFDGITGAQSLHDSSQLSASTAQGYGGCSEDSLTAQTASPCSFASTMGFVLGLNSGLNCSTDPLQPPPPMDSLPEAEREDYTWNRPQRVSHGPGSETP